MAEFNDYAYIACAREYYYTLKSTGKSLRDQLCRKYQISTRFTPYLVRMTDETTDAEIISWKAEMAEKERLRRHACLARMKEEREAALMREEQEVEPAEEEPVKEDCEPLPMTSQFPKPTARRSMWTSLLTIWGMWRKNDRIRT